MRFLDVAATASSNMLRSKVRSILTIIAIFVGAFTITLTVGISSGISSYIDGQLGNLGADDVLIVRGQSELESGSDEPQKYNPNTAVSSAGQFGVSRVVLTDKDIEVIRSQSEIVSAEPSLAVAVDYVEGDNGEKYKVSVSAFIEGTNLQLAAGNSFDGDSDENGIILPLNYVSVLGYSSNEDAIGQSVSLGITDATGTQNQTTATIKGVQEQTLISSGGASINQTLLKTLSELQNQGLPESAKDKHQVVLARFDPSITDQELQSLKDKLADEGYSAVTVQDQIGIVKEVINAITYVLIFFGAIALLAASFGIVNTLFMAVQERTKEIGLMKAVGMSRNKIFMLFSFEAVLLGFWGSALGVLAAVGVGNIANGIAADSFLKDLQGFDLTVFPLQSVLVIIVLVMAIAFLAGTLPARRAAKQNPIDALRYE